jgi:ligand-binding sensor domain-containing protein
MIPFNLLFFPCAFISSCNGQVKNDLPKDSLSKARYKLNVIPSWQPKTNAVDYDPYFIETKTINTSYGSQSITRNIVQDRNGYFWLASREGIIRHDGTTFTNFTNQDSLRRYRAFSVLEDKGGNILFGTIGAGVYRYYGHSFTNFTTKHGLVHDKVGCILEDKKGNIWAGATGLSVYQYDGDSFKFYKGTDRMDLT